MCITRFLALCVSLLMLEQGQAESLMEELQKMTDRKVTIFSTKDHPKSEGLTFEVRYPSDWLSSEGLRPAVLRKFHSENGKGFLMLILNVVELPVSSEELAQASEDEKYFAESDVAEMVPKGSKVLKIQRTRLDGDPCTMVEFQNVVPNAGLDVTTNNLYFYVLTGKYMVTIAGSLVKKPDQSDASFDVDWQAAKLLFRSIASSFYLPQKWEDKHKAISQ